MSEISKIVYPWNDTGFQGSHVDKQCVYDNLRKLRYPVHKFKLAPSKRVTSVVNRLLTEYLFKDKWIFVTSNSTNLLQALAILTPIVYSLSTMWSCYSVNTEKLTSIFSMRRPMDDFSPDPQGEIMREIETATLLVWEDVGERVPDSSRMPARFVQLLRQRIARPCSTMFTMSYIGKWNPTAFDVKLKVGITGALGETAYSLITENSKFLNFPVEQEESKEIATYKF